MSGEPKKTEISLISQQGDFIEDHYYRDREFETADDFLNYFLADTRFRTYRSTDAFRNGTGTFIFRGQANADWALIPNSFRPCKLEEFTVQPPLHEPVREHARRYLGGHLFAEAQAVNFFLKEADALGLHTPIDFNIAKESTKLALDALNNKDRDYTELYPPQLYYRALAFAQHYGVPTRLLDWTESPMIAAYFAAYEASSVVDKNARIQSDFIAVYYMTTMHKNDKKSPIEIINAPRAENGFMRAQQGVFTNIKCANTYYLEHLKWPSLEDVANVASLQINRAIIKSSLADDILRRLFDMNITRSSLMPSLNNAALHCQYIRRLYG